MDASLTQVGRPWLEVHPDQSQKCHSQAKLASPRLRNLATHPFGGPMSRPGTKQDDVNDNPPPPWSKMYTFQDDKPPLRHSEPSHPAAQRPGVTASKLQDRRWPGGQKNKKIKYFPNPPGRGLGGSGGPVWGSGRPVGLEKLVDSMTCKLTPTTKIDLAPVFWEVRLVRNSKTQKKRRIIIASTPKTSFFAIEMEDAQDIQPPKWIRLQAMAGHPQESGNEPTTWAPSPDREARGCQT